MNYYLFKTPSGKEYKLRLSSSGQKQFYEETGKGLIEAYGLAANIPGYIVPVMIWCSAQAFHHGFKLKDAEALYDELVEEGFVLDDFMVLVTEVLGVSGFFGKEELESIREDLKKPETTVPNKSN